MEMIIDQGKLLRGKDVIINNVGVLKPIIVDEIIEIGEKKYYQYLNNLCFDIDDLQVTGEEKQKLLDENATTFQIICINCFYNMEFLKMILEAFKFFLKEDICFVKQLGTFFINDFENYRFITSKNYEEIKTILKLQNGLLKDDILDDNPKDERTRMLLEKRRKAREKLAKAKAKQNEGDSTPLTFADLISIMCANANGVNNNNVWNMNIYFFQDQFQRMKLIEDYDIGIRSLLAGANSEEVDLKHYMSHL